MINNAAVPILGSAFVRIRMNLAEHNSFTDNIASLAIILLFCCYPFVIHKFLNKQLRSIDKKKFESLNLHHRPAILNLKLKIDDSGLGYILVAHIRRIAFAAVVVMLHLLPVFQI